MFKNLCVLFTGAVIGGSTVFLGGMVLVCFVEDDDYEEIVDVFRKIRAI